MMHRCGHRALTLLEVLASLVIIALLAGVCVPMLRSAAAVIGETPLTDASGAQLDLEALADAFAKDPAVFGVASLDDLSTAEITAPDAPEPVIVVRLSRQGQDDDAECDHDWIVCRHGDLIALRFRVLPDSKERQP